MADTIILSQSQYKNLVTRIGRLEKVLIELVKKIDAEPYEGTKAWWEWTHKKGMEAKKRGEFTRLETRKDLENFFKTL